MSETTSGNKPQTFGRYSVMEPLAKGGMAQIYKAKTATGRTFTLKKILKDFSDNSEFIQMFLEEAKISLNLKHPNVIRVLDFGQIDGSYFLAMEFVFGRDVSALLKKCAESRIYIPMDVVCHIIYQCCLGLDYAHNQRDAFGKPLNIVHRDISPPNILVGYNGEVKILDFGIAKAVSGSKNREQTRSGVLKGKFSYMSPEQASGKPIDAQSDVFSLGTVFYELLTTRNLFYMPDEMETLERVRKADVKSPSKVRKDIPSELDKIVMKALTLKTKNRFKSCGEMAIATQQFLQSYYPRSDSRSVAKFLRGVFSEDYQLRYRPSVSEGWQDVLQVGGSDDDLMLDHGDSRSDNRVMPAVSQELQWYHRILYDPRTKAEFIKNTFRGVALAVFLALALFSYRTFRPRNTPKVEAPQAGSLLPGEALSPHPSAAESPVAKHEEAPPLGSFAYWTKEAATAEAKFDFEAALRAYNRALEINSFELPIQIKKNFVLLALGQIDDACKWFQKKSELPSEDKLLSSAICQEAGGDSQRALGAYSDFLSRYPEDRRIQQVKLVVLSLKKKWKR